jgi:hypothetical protein
VLLEDRRSATHNDSATLGQTLKLRFTSANAAVEEAAQKPDTLSFRAKRGISPSFFLQLNQREIPRFARNDRMNYFFRAP